jgi:hypothetical protein
MKTSFIHLMCAEAWEEVCSLGVREIPDMYGCQIGVGGADMMVEELLAMVELEELTKVVAKNQLQSIELLLVNKMNS